MAGEPQTQVGRLRMEVEGEWWVAYFAQPETMNDAIELARIRMALVNNHPQRQHAFTTLVAQALKQLMPEYTATPVPPEQQRSSRA